MMRHHLKSTLAQYGHNAAVPVLDMPVLGGMIARHMFAREPAILFENAHLLDPLDGVEMFRWNVSTTLRLARGRIVGIGVPPQRGDRCFDLDGALVVPGFINAHDHLELNNFPRLKLRESYTHARHWLDDLARLRDSDPVILAARAVPLADRLYQSALKNLLAGVTTVAHHNPLHRPLRRGYPLHVVTRYGWAHSLYLTPNFATTYRRTPRAFPWMIHLAEGTDAEAQGELARLDAAGALQSNTVLIHGVGLSAADRQRVIQRGAALVWCPGSNFFLLGATAEVKELAAQGRLALGSDSRLSGGRDLLDELRIARYCWDAATLRPNSDAAPQQLTPAALLRAVTCDAARILRLNEVGRIAPRMRADLVILPRPTGAPCDFIGRVRRDELRAVIVNGRLRIADPDFAPLLPDAVPTRLDGRPKILARDLAQRYARCTIPEPGLQVEELPMNAQRSPTVV